VPEAPEGAASANRQEQPEQQLDCRVPKQMPARDDSSLDGCVNQCEILTPGRGQRTLQNQAAQVQPARTAGRSGLRGGME